jgi:hypothetical protein
VIPHWKPTFSAFAHRAPVSYQLLNPSSDFLELVVDLVLPNANHGPTFGIENPVGTPISFNILRELPIPELRVRRRLCLMLGAPVPKAAIDKHRDALGRKNNVGLSGQASNLAEPQPTAPQCATQRYLWLGVATADSRHAATALGSGHNVSHTISAYPVPVQHRNFAVRVDDQVRERFSVSMTGT